jgi:hypothetical protein
MATAAIDREDHSHPERVYKDLVFALGEDQLIELRKKRKDIIDCNRYRRNHDGDLDEELCWSCGWKIRDELLASYGSRIRIFHTQTKVGLWEVGSRWLIRNQPGLDIPLVKEMRRLSAPTDKVCLTLMSRAQGARLDTIWHTLSPEQKSKYMEQLGYAIKQWRQFTSPVAKKVDGSPIYDTLVGSYYSRRANLCKEMGRTTDEWFEMLEKGLRHGLRHLHKGEDPSIVDEKLQELKKNFPKSEPYVLTHGDLKFNNIIVKDNRIEAIIDWECSGYLPWWAERWMSTITTKGDPFFASIWTDIDSDMNEDTFKTEVTDKLTPVVHNWFRHARSLEVGNDQSSWLRPGFCKCKPIAGRFQLTGTGNWSRY